MKTDLTGTGDMLRNADVGHMMELREKLAESERELTAIMENATRLAARFRKMESCRRDVAEGLRERGECRVASQSDAVADHYARCAGELERTIAGETPPEPGEDWPRSAAPTYSRPA